MVPATTRATSSATVEASRSGVPRTSPSGASIAATTERPGLSGWSSLTIAQPRKVAPPAEKPCGIAALQPSPIASVTNPATAPDPGEARSTNRLLASERSNGLVIPDLMRMVRRR